VPVRTLASMNIDFSSSLTSRIEVDAEFDRGIFVKIGYLTPGHAAFLTVLFMRFFLKDYIPEGGGDSVHSTETSLPFSAVTSFIEASVVR